jgi:hypothetical protein
MSFDRVALGVFAGYEPYWEGEVCFEGSMLRSVTILSHFDIGALKLENIFRAGLHQQCSCWTRTWHHVSMDW